MRRTTVEPEICATHVSAGYIKPSSPGEMPKPPEKKTKYAHIFKEEVLFGTYTR